MHRSIRQFPLHFNCPAFAYQFGGKFLFRRQIEFVTGREYLVVSFRQSEAYDRVALIRAQHDADGWILDFSRHFPLIVVDVHLHLSEILMGKLSDLEVDQHKTSRQPVVEYQIDEEMPSVQCYPLLSRHERKAFPQFKEKMLQLVDQGAFKVFFQKTVILTDAGKFQNVDRKSTRL